MHKNEVINIVINSHREHGKRNNGELVRSEDPGYKYLFGTNKHNEGYFLIWNSDERVGQLDSEAYTTVIQESKRANLKQPFHIYARYETYQSKNVVFYKIPDKILSHLGLDEKYDSFNTTVK